MKKIIIAFIAMLMVVPSGKIYAHEHHHHRDTANVSAPDSLTHLEMAEHKEMEAINAFPNYHPLVVHFPIVLLLLAAVFQLLSFFVFRKELSWGTLGILFFGVIATWLSSNTFHADPEALTGRAKEIFETHEQMASLTWWFSLGALLIKFLSNFFFKRKWWFEAVVTLLLIASAVTVSIAGHHGAMLVHMEGVGPLGKHLEAE